MSSFSHRSGRAAGGAQAKHFGVAPRVFAIRIAMEKERKVRCILGKGHFLIPDKLISSPTPEIKLETANGLLATGKAKAS